MLKLSRHLDQKKVVRKSEVVYEKISDVFKVWAQLHLSLIEGWTEQDWTMYNKTKESFFTFPYKWVVVGVAKTKKEALEKAKINNIKETYLKLDK
tara:strand:+ start:283 stop:567 length:285 start_codon:yes stop_codon:yes gene_type:complete